VPLSVPLVGLTVTVKVRERGGVFGSEPVSVTAVAVSCGTVTACAVAVGLPTSVIETVAAALVSRPLLSVNWKLSGPKYPAAGV